MKTSGTLLMVAYVTSIFMFMNFTSLLMFWIMLEVNMLIFILMIKSFKSKETHSMMLFYFMVQSMGSLIFLVGNVTSENVILSGLPNLFELALMIKMGMYPFHSWVYKMSVKMESLTFFLLLSIQKLPIILFMSHNSLEFLILMLIVNLIAGALLLLYSKSMKEVLVSSSIFISFWMFMMASLSPIMFFLMFSSYMVMTWDLFFVGEDKKFKGFLESPLSVTSTMFLMSLPPASMFFFKFYTIEMMEKINSNSVLMLIWLSSFGALVGYFMFFFYGTVIKETLEKSTIKKMGKNKSMLVFIVGSCIALTM